MLVTFISFYWQSPFSFEVAVIYKYHIVGHGIISGQSLALVQ